MCDRARIDALGFVRLQQHRSMIGPGLGSRRRGSPTKTDVSFGESSIPCVPARPSLELQPTQHSRCKSSSAEPVYVTARFVIADYAIADSTARGVCDS